MSSADGKRRHRDFVEALKEERRKIQMFSRELPLCLQLVTEAIEKFRRQMADEEDSSNRPVLEEFISPTPRSSSSVSSGGLCRGKDAAVCKSDWLRSVQLWGPAVPDESPAGGSTLKKPVALKAGKVGGAFQPFEREKVAPSVPEPYVEAAVRSNTMTIGGDRGGDEDKENAAGFEGNSMSPAQPNRKPRRCWSPDLHRKFLHALEQLGGSQVATPKQIRELMKVDGLTNDEVKSHLQKYRLHTRRPTTAVQSSTNSNPQTPQGLLVLGGIWASPSEYAAAAAAAVMAASVAQSTEGSSAGLNGAFSPVASLPVELRSEEDKKNKKPQLNTPFPLPLCSQQRLNQNDDILKEDGEPKSNSCSTSLSSETSTASPAS
ncbi:hypothetical protein HPP92_021801 [Vanilla planifolia]|uniref:HTH myb-type domain-containing protein n=1 Tax=Vanilla planifolia TaxID=51239 RepID=A0A835Q1U8_VANPL|nr:hypothetical protein HPP92_021801 [Vanilla planifolia]